MGSTVSMTLKKKTSTSEVSLLSRSFQPITVCLRCPALAQPSPRVRAAETETRRQGRVFTRVLKRHRLRGEGFLSKTRRGQVASRRRRRDSTNIIMATSLHSPHITSTIPTLISSTHTTSSTHCPWRRSTARPWRDTKLHWLWSTARNTRRAWESPSVPACTTARCKTVTQEPGRGLNLRCPAAGGKEHPMGQWEVWEAAKGDTWGPMVTIAAPKRGLVAR